MGAGRYRPHAAQARAAAGRPRPKTRKLAAQPALRQVVQEYLNVRWSPEQIMRRLRRDFPDRPEMHVCHEMIYPALYQQAMANCTARSLDSCVLDGRFAGGAAGRSGCSGWRPPWS